VSHKCLKTVRNNLGQQEKEEKLMVTMLNQMQF